MPWIGTTADVVGRIARRWLDPEVDPRFEFVRFDLSPAGEAFAQDAYHRTAQPQ